MDYEEILHEISTPSERYQIFIFLILSLTPLQSSLDICSIPFMSYVPTKNFSCTDPALANASWLSNDQCTIYFNNTSSIFHSGSQPCTQWSYDTSELGVTIAMDFDLVCDKSYLVPMRESIYFAGMAIGMIVGSLGDKIGRKRAIMCCSVWEILICIITPFMPSFTLLTFVRFMRGFSMSIYYHGLTMISEIVVTKRRAIYCNLFWLFWAAGYMSTSGFVMASKDWKEFRLFTCIPQIVYLLFFLLPESPRWLCTKGRRDEAVDVFIKIARLNGKTLTKDYFKNFEPPGQEQSGKFIDALKSPTLRIRLVVFWMVQSVVALCYFGLSTQSKYASKNMYLSAVIMGAIEIPCSIIGWISSDKLGRRLPSSIFFVSTTVCIIVLPFLSPSLDILRTILAVVGKISITTAYCIVDIYVNELFPTSIRNTALMTSVTFSSISTILAPYINHLKYTAPYLPNLIFGILSFIAGTLIWIFLPETYKCPLAQTVKEAERLIRGKENEWIRQMKMASSENGENEMKDLLNGHDIGVEDDT